MELSTTVRAGKIQLNFESSLLPTDGVLAGGMKFDSVKVVKLRSPSECASNFWSWQGQVVVCSSNQVDGDMIQVELEFCTTSTIRRNRGDVNRRLPLTNSTGGVVRT